MNITALIWITYATADLCSKCNNTKKSHSAINSHGSLFLHYRLHRNIERPVAKAGRAIQLSWGYDGTPCEN